MATESRLEEHYRNAVSSLGRAETGPLDDQTGHLLTAIAEALLALTAAVAGMPR